jgi:hypothetical protein
MERGVDDRTAAGVERTGRPHPELTVVAFVTPAA